LFLAAGDKVELEMVAPSVLAVFWTAENMDEKNVAAGFGDAGPFSGVGVSGADMMLDSLLGPAPESALRRWAIILPADASVERALPPFALSGW
jgi:hypothetical protein